MPSEESKSLLKDLATGDKEEALKVLADRITRLGIKAQSLIRASFPQLLLGNAYVHLLSSVQGASCESEMPEESAVILRLLEYSHAVYSSFPEDPNERQLTPEEYEELVFTVRELYNATQLWVAFSPSRVGQEETGLEYWAKTAWMAIRRVRYSPQDIPFLEMMLGPHSDMIEATYDIRFAEFFDGIKKIHHAVHKALTENIRESERGRDWCTNESKSRGISFYEAVAEYLIDETKPEIIRNALSALWYPKYLNISEITQWPEKLIDDVSYSRGEVTHFFDAGPISGWLLKTLPCRRKPFVKLADGAYAFEPNFSIEALYRGLQHGILSRNPELKEEWNRRQKQTSEQAFVGMLSPLFKNAKIFSGVWYPIGNGNWAECDSVILLDDVLLVVEAKAGMFTYASPEEDFEKHLAAVRRLVIEAYEQTRRFVEYLSSSPVVQLFGVIDGERVEVGRLRFSNLRAVFPIGLTLENLSSFSGLIKKFSEARPILDHFPFLTFAVDDLFVFRDLINSVDQLVHYFEVRQAVELKKSIRMHDEMDRLGAYLQVNRFDTLADEHQKATFISIEGMSDVIDKFYMVDECAEGKKPTQKFPPELKNVLTWVQEKQPSGWLRTCSAIRNLSDLQRNEFDKLIVAGRQTIQDKPYSVSYLPGTPSLSIVQCNCDRPISTEELLEVGAALAHAFEKEKEDVICINHRGNLIDNVRFTACAKPLPIMRNYAAILQRAANIKKHHTEKEKERSSGKPRRK